MITSAVVQLLYAAANVYTWIILAYCIMTWFPTSSGTIADIRCALEKITAPFLDIFRKIIPPIGGMVDISPIVALLVLQFGVNLIARLLFMLF